jgi:hypothetical protein
LPTRISACRKRQDVAARRRAERRRWRVRQPPARETSNDARGRDVAFQQAEKGALMSQRESGYQRKPLDQYETPPWVTLALIPHLPELIG